MADWTDIPNTSLEPDAPARSIDAFAFRDNPIAIAEGAAGAPRIAGQQGPAVNTGGIFNGAVSNAKIANGAVSNVKVANGTLGAEKFQAGGTERDWVLSRTASAGANMVGTYAFAAVSGSTAYSFGDTASGNLLIPSNVGDVPQGNMSGTWRCMGRVPPPGDRPDRTTLWLRIS